MVWSKEPVSELTRMQRDAFNSNFILDITLLAPMLTLLAEHQSEIGYVRVCVIMPLNHKLIFPNRARLGIGFAFQGVGGLIGTPITGALLTSSYIWWRPVVYSAVSIQNFKFEKFLYLKFISPVSVLWWTNIICWMSINIAEEAKYSRMGNLILNSLALFLESVIRLWHGSYIYQLYLQLYHTLYLKCYLCAPCSKKKLLLINHFFHRKKVPL